MGKVVPKPEVETKPDVVEDAEDLDNPEETSKNSSTIPTLKTQLAVRKFPSYGWNREREARIRIEANTPTTIDNSATVAVPTKRLLSRNLPDFPPFQLR